MESAFYNVTPWGGGGANLLILPLKMFMKRNLTVSLCTAALITVFAAATAQAVPTPTEAVAACVENAWAVNSACQTDNSHWNDVLCAVKFEADAILCIEVLIR